tara:strand:+ start:1147 stop:1344 length:198 start_codon:yes stop_codon:yes gene_type:complete
MTNPLRWCLLAPHLDQGSRPIEAQDLVLLQALPWACWDEQKDLVLSYGLLGRRLSDGCGCRVDRR